MKHSTENLRHTRWECKYHVVFIRVNDASVSWPDRFERFTNQASGSAGGT
jgi:REP element-mobilizing transposase RayT